jgi:hypothetical protein
MGVIINLVSGQPEFKLCLWFGTFITCLNLFGCIKLYPGPFVVFITLPRNEKQARAFSAEFLLVA